MTRDFSIKGRSCHDALMDQAHVRAVSPNEEVDPVPWEGEVGEVGAVAADPRVQRVLVTQRGRGGEVIEQGQSHDHGWGQPDGG